MTRHHAATANRLRRRIHPADASAALRRSRHLARVFQPSPGAPEGAGTPPAGLSVQAPHPAAATNAIAVAVERQLLAKVPAPERPRRMGLCGEVADDGGKSGGPPRPRWQIRKPRGLVSSSAIPAKFVRRRLNLFHAAQTYLCLGHCITRGIGLRRQASILRLSGAALFGRPARHIRSTPLAMGIIEPGGTFRFPSRYRNRAIPRAASR
jgi:hypothetical protein